MINSKKNDGTRGNIDIQSEICKIRWLYHYLLIWPTVTEIEENENSYCEINNLESSVDGIYEEIWQCPSGIRGGVEFESEVKDEYHSVEDQYHETPVDESSRIIKVGKRNLCFK